MKQYFILGSYTEPILFGTGEVFQGKGKGISVCTFENGEIKVIKEIAIRNPSFMCIDEKNRKIYSVNELKKYQGQIGGGITQLSYEADYSMSVEGSWNTHGTDPCHVALEPGGTFVSVANFANGVVTICPMDKKGNIKGDFKLFQHEGNSIHPVRQKESHAHSCIFAPETNRMYVPDLGIDKVVAYQFSEETIYVNDENSFEVPSGSGPRFGEFGKEGKHFYLINEITSQVMHFQHSNGNMIATNAVPTLPDDFIGDNICSDLHITPDGKLLYASNRGHDSLVCYQLEQDGSPTFIERQSCGGKTPRNFAIDPTGEYILVGNQDSDTIVVFKIEENGHLVQISQTEVGSPVCIRFFDFG